MLSETVADPVDQSASDEGEIDQAAYSGSHDLEEDTNQEEEHHMAYQGIPDRVETLEDQSAGLAEGSNTEKEVAESAEAVAVVVELAVEALVADSVVVEFVLEVELVVVVELMQELVAVHSMEFLLISFTHTQTQFFPYYKCRNFRRKATEISTWGLRSRRSNYGLHPICFIS